MKPKSAKAKKGSFENSLIICNGKTGRRLLTKFFKPKKIKSKYFIAAADGAANTLHKYKYVPDIIIGDLDSIKPKVLKYYKSKKVTVKKIIDQNLNDFEKALQLVISKKIKNIFVLGATGRRIDHVLNNLSVLKRNYKKADIKLIDNHFEIFFAKGKSELVYRKNEVLSLMAMAKTTGIKTTGLKYPLNNETLEFGVREGALNTSTGKTITIEIGRGELLVFKRHFGKINLLTSFISNSQL